VKTIIGVSAYRPIQFDFRCYELLFYLPFTQYVSRVAILSSGLHIVTFTNLRDILKVK
jgi:hypothetical protein